MTFILPKTLLIVNLISESRNRLSHSHKELLYLGVFGLKKCISKLKQDHVAAWRWDFLTNYSHDGLTRPILANQSRPVIPLLSITMDSGFCIRCTVAVVLRSYTMPTILNPNLGNEFYCLQYPVLK